MLSEATRRKCAETMRKFSMTQTAEVRRRGTISDGAGGRTSIPQVVESGLSASAATIRFPQMTVEGGRPLTVADWVISLASADPDRTPDTLDVLPADEIAITLSGGRVELYRVVSTDKGKTDALRLSVQAKKIS